MELVLAQTRSSVAADWEKKQKTFLLGDQRFAVSSWPAASILGDCTYGFIAVTSTEAVEEMQTDANVITLLFGSAFILSSEILNWETGIRFNGQSD